MNYRIQKREDGEWVRIGIARTMRGAQSLAERKLRGYFAGFTKVGEACSEDILEGTPLNPDGTAMNERVRIEKGWWS